MNSNWNSKNGKLNSNSYNGYSYSANVKCSFFSI